MSELTYLAHHGVKGQKHGVRQYQNKDGSLTALGRVHYGVGAAKEAAHNVKESIRKKVAPTNAELNVQIRKQKSKNLNKKKREQLRQLKKGIDVDAMSKLDDSKRNGPHKKFSEMSDKEISDRINRLKNEVTLADLEAKKNLSPGKRMIYEALKDGGKKAISKVAEDVLTTAGKSFFGIEDKNDKNDKKDKSAKSILEELKATEDLNKWYEEHTNQNSKSESKVGSAVKNAAKNAAKKTGSAVASGAKKAAKATANAVVNAATAADEKSTNWAKKQYYKAKGADYRGPVDPNDTWTPSDSKAIVKRKK